MGYRCEVTCDKCGDGFYWVNNGPNARRAIRIARMNGWQVGKKGWFCPKCRTRKRSNNEVH